MTQHNSREMTKELTGAELVQVPEEVSELVEAVHAEGLCHSIGFNHN